MKVGIIGPNQLFDKNLEERKQLLEKVAKIIAKTNNDIVLTPDKGSLLEYFGKKFTQFGGKNIFLVIPTDEKGHEEYLNTELGEIISCTDWDRQANEFNRQCDIFICLGYSWGALKEMACAQYFNKKKIYIINEFISQELPKELNFLLNYISLKDIEKII